MSLRDLLNKHKWYHENLDSLEIVIRHRGAPDDERVICGALIQEVKANGFTTFDLSATDIGTMSLSWIPYHRVLTVQASEDVLWQRKTVNANAQ